MIKWKSNLHCGENGFGYEGITLPSGSFSQGSIIRESTNIYNAKRYRGPGYHNAPLKYEMLTVQFLLVILETLFNLENISIYSSLRRQIFFLLVEEILNWCMHLYSNFGSAVWIYVYVWA